MRSLCHAKDDYCPLMTIVCCLYAEMVAHYRVGPKHWPLRLVRVSVVIAMPCADAVCLFYTLTLTLTLTLTRVLTLTLILTLNPI